MVNKICSKCKLEKNILDFVKSQLARTNSKCKFCQKEYSKNNKNKIDEYNRKYYQENKTELDIRHVDYYYENRDYLIECGKLYYQKNKGRLLAQQKLHSKKRNNEYYLRRYRNDISYKLRQLVARSIRQAMKRNSSRKIGSCISQLLFSIQELKVHLESQFEPWMTWKNHGRYDANSWDDNNTATWTWQIDHIVPQSNFPYTSMKDANFKKCWALSNLRPLSAKQNILAGTSKTRHRKIKNKSDD